MGRNLLFWRILKRARKRASFLPLFGLSNLGGPGKEQACVASPYSRSIEWFPPFGNRLVGQVGPGEQRDPAGRHDAARRSPG